VVPAGCWPAFVAARVSDYGSLFEFVPWAYSSGFWVGFEYYFGVRDVEFVAVVDGDSGGGDSDGCEGEVREEGGGDEG